jgi:hypothetical protein
MREESEEIPQKMREYRARLTLMIPSVVVNSYAQIRH